MNVKIFFVLLLVFVLVVPDADGWGWRRRRRRRPAPAPVCKHYCIQDCSNGCKWRCIKTCGRKRSIKSDADATFEDTNDQDSAASGYRGLFAVPLPYKMAIYDADKDGRISFHEFIRVLPKPADRGAARSTFKALDKNGDKYIDCQELGKVAPEKKTEC